MQKPCIKCLQQFLCFPSTQSQKYCSYSCYWKDRKDRKMYPPSRLGTTITNEHKKRISIANRGRIVSPLSIRKTVEKTRKWLNSLSVEEKKQLYNYERGEKHWNWRGGVTPYHKSIRHGLEFRAWREKVFKKDKWICQKCKIKGGFLRPHHIKNFADYPSLRLVTSNGITFCTTCHNQFHKIYGQRHTNPQQLLEFLTICQ